MKPLQNTRVVLGLVGQASATTVRTALIDTANASSAKIIVSTTANTNSSAGVVVAVSSGSDGTSTTGYTSVGSSSATATIDAARVVDIDLNGKDRYLYVTVTPGTAGTTDAVAVGALTAELVMGIQPNNSTTQLGNVVL